MITINDNDLPITVAEKLIKGTKPTNNPLNKAFGGDGTEDMFSQDDLVEIARYLLTYDLCHVEGD